MLEVTVHEEALVKSLKILQEEFQRTCANAVVETASELMSNIVFKTLGPAPPPPVRFYKRTYRLVHGWGPAARLLGIYMPPLSPVALTSSDEGTAYLLENEQGAFFKAENRVPYAWEVEFVGTWKDAELNFRAPYNIVGSSEQEMAKPEKFPKNVRDAWEIALDAA